MQASGHLQSFSILKRNLLFIGSVRFNSTATAQDRGIYFLSKFENDETVNNYNFLGAWHIRQKFHELFQKSRPKRSSNDYRPAFHECF